MHILKLRTPEEMFTLLAKLVGLNKKKHALCFLIISDETSGSNNNNHDDLTLHPPQGIDCHAMHLLLMQSCRLVAIKKHNWHVAMIDVPCISSGH